MEKHLIVLDLDGTLLNSKKEISNLTRRTLERLKEEGHEIMIATGRPFRASVPYYNELRLSTPIVNFNGAYVHHPLIPSWKPKHMTIDLPLVHDIINKATTMNVKNIIAEVKDDVYIEQFDQHLMPIFDFGDPTMVQGSIIEHLEVPATSLLLQSTKYEIEALRKAILDEHVEALYYHEWGEPFHILELIHRSVNKAVGIQYVQDLYQIPTDRIIAFGDETNDLEMIQYVGTGVAMGNAIQELKSCANAITLSNDKDGIAHFLQQYFHQL